MRGKMLLYRSQYGQCVLASTVAGLCRVLGYAPGTARRMYVDRAGGTPCHIGYVVGLHWMTAYTPWGGES